MATATATVTGMTMSASRPAGAAWGVWCWMRRTKTPIGSWALPMMSVAFEPGAPGKMRAVATHSGAGSTETMISTWMKPASSYELRSARRMTAATLARQMVWMSKVTWVTLSRCTGRKGGKGGGGESGGGGGDGEGGGG